MGSRPVKQYNIGIFGEKNCGKTSLLEKFIQSNVKSNLHSTITPEIIDVPNYNFNEEKYNLKIWDINI